METPLLPIHTQFVGHFIESITCRWDDRGATLVEYGVVVMMIALVLIVLVEALGGSVVDMFSSVMPGFGG